LEIIYGLEQFRREDVTNVENVGIGRWMRSAGEKEFCRDNGLSIIEKIEYFLLTIRYEQK
jgi:hypothetical protein